MRRTMLKSKIHRATVTDCDLNYVGSITLDLDLLETSDIRVHELVHVVNITTGGRFETYAMPGERGSGDVKLNGGAARLAQRGDTIVVLAYADYEAHELEYHVPRIVHVASGTNVVIDLHEDRAQSRPESYSATSNARHPDGNDALRV